MTLRSFSLVQCLVLSAVIAASIVWVIEVRQELHAQLGSGPILVPASSSSSSSIPIYLETGDEFPVYGSSVSSRKSSSSSSSLSSFNYSAYLETLPQFEVPSSSSLPPPVSSISSSSSQTPIPIFPTQFPEEYQAISSAPPVHFSDVSRLNREGNAIYLLAERGIISGFPDGTFRPDIPINRAEITKLILRARSGDVEIPDLVYTGTFTDVPPNEWYVKYIMRATQLGIISGYPDGTFKAGYIVNTVEFLKMISIAFKIDPDWNYNYQDVPRSIWFAQYAGTAAHFELFPDRPLHFLQPERFLTRGEVAYALSRLLRL